MPSFKAILHLREPFMKLISELSTTNKRVVVIHDYLMSSVVQDFDSVPNAEVYMFQVCSAFASFWYHWEQTQKLKLDDETESLRSNLPSMEGCFSNEFVEILASQDSAFKKISKGTLYDTSKVFEEKYLSYLIAKMLAPEQARIGLSVHSIQLP